ncbi:interleukin 15, like isoform X2 [Pseudorasbora parva]|uniref:interleukin 15, like isoform X2 n=1 Tax=Pseudorasbora parva TaxID=51549 RepID=UPI00351EB859
MTYLVLRGSWIFDMRTDLLHYSMCFTSLFLYLLIMLTRQIKCQPACSKEGAGIVKNITDELIEAVWFLSWQEKEYMLYTPTLADFKNCSSSTLTCFALELNVLIFEIQSVSTKFQKLFRILNNLSKHKKRYFSMKQGGAESCWSGTRPLERLIMRDADELFYYFCSCVCGVTQRCFIILHTFECVEAVTTLFIFFLST